MTLPAFFANSLRVAVSAALLWSQVLPASELRAAPTAVDMLVQKARSLEARDRQDLAAQVWHQVLVTDPNQPEALAALARWAKRTGKNEEANGYLAKLRRLSPDSPALTQLESPASDSKGSSRLDEAARLADNRRFDEAMRIYREVFGSNPPAGGWSIAYYQTLANTNGGFDPAVAALKQLSETYPDVVEYKLAAGTLMTYRPATREAGIRLLASISGSTATAVKAKAAWRQALIWEKSNPAYLPEIDTYLARYKDTEIQSVAAGMPAQTPGAATPSAGSREEQLGYRALQDGNVTEAERQFNLALSKDSASWRAHAGLGFVHMKTGDFDAAVQELEIAHKSGSSGDANVRNSLASAKFWQAMHRGAKAADKQDWTAAVTFYGAAAALRGSDPQAMRALGGALLAAGSPAKAIPFLTKAAQGRGADELSWVALAQAKLEAQGGRAALALMDEAPASIATSLDRNISWKALRASAYAAAGEDAQALKIYRDLTATEVRDITPDEQVQVATLALHFHQAPVAVSCAEKALATKPYHAGAWEILLSSLVASGRGQEAARRYSSMPAETEQAVMQHSGFQQTLASIKESNGDLDGARTLLQQVIASPGTASNEHEQVGAKLHLAQILAKLGQSSEAETMMSSLTDSHPEDVDVWRAQILVLQSLNHPNDIVLSAARMPEAVAVRLGREGDIVNILASAHVATGDKVFGVKLLENYISRSENSDASNAVAQRIQLAWLLLDFPGDSGRLYNLLDQLDARTDLVPEQRKELSNLWVTWIERAADTAHKAGNEQRALALLEQGASSFPTNTDLQGALAGKLLAVGNTRRALNIYSNWGMAGAQPDDYAGAIGAALAERNFAYADAWIEHSLAQWPGNSKLLALAGDRAQARGDMKNAEILWKQALAQKKADAANAQTLATTDSQQPSLKTLLAGAGHVPDAAALRPEGGAKVHLSSFQPDSTPGQGFVGQGLAASLGDSAGMAPTLRPNTDATYAPKALLAAPVSSDPLEDKIIGIESRNTPYIGSSTSVWDRSGQSGFSRLVIQQTEFEASTTLANELRASFLLIPTYLSSGTADGSGDALFGRQTAAAGFGNQNAGGVAAEAQLSSQSVGLRIGTTPQGFLLHNWIGGLRVQPKHGPITLLLERDSMKDSMLAYAGARDPVSNQVWGGVMANTASLQGRWGDDKSGIYVNGGYQTVEGRSVARNTGLNGNAGVWWKVASVSTGNLTLGMNFSAMHYDRNLRYFTFGQGGYFSPQQYVLFSVPLRWTGNYGRNLQYTVGGSLGSQHFTEDASDYYPLDAALQARTGTRYAAFASTGANFSFDARLSYQMAPHWNLGAFATANNARNYTAAAAGLFVKYTFEERPMDLKTAAPSVPDWRGQQPFLLF